MIENDLFEYPHSLGLLFPILRFLLGIIFNSFKLISIKTSIIELNQVEIIKDNKNQVKIKIESYSYGNDFKKLILTLLSFSWFLIPILIFSNYFGCNKRYYYDNQYEANPIQDLNIFSIFIFGIQLLINIFSNILMEISMVL
ncbi:hypothetical protein ACTA71_000435 [Dictyostelium dimigraforme]